MSCIVIVDPISTGGNIAAEAARRGYPLVAVWDKELSDINRTHVPSCARSLTYHAQVDEKETIKETAEAVKTAVGDLELAAVICGSEAGVTLADALSVELNVRTNGNSAGRRDKKVQQELVRGAGLRSVRQAGGTKLSDIKEFLSSEPMPVVVKPVESAGSDGVKLCHTIEEAEEHFTLLMTSQRKVGSQNASVLCQEFLKGKEYVVDHVSRDGVHKTTMVWMYDKRKANGGDFVYYGMVPVDVQSKEAQEMIPYVRGVLDALGMKNGPSHGEVMMTQRGPCLVEMNCRAHGGDGAWDPLARELTGGFTQVNGSIDSYMDQVAFD
jgi:biotin carboxylase